MCLFFLFFQPEENQNQNREANPIKVDIDSIYFPGESLNETIHMCSLSAVPPSSASSASNFFKMDIEKVKKLTKLTSSKSAHSDKLERFFCPSFFCSVFRFENICHGLV
jgi:hypothetical protein